MQTISHANVFEMLAADLDLSEGTLRDRLTVQGASEFVKYLKYHNISIFTHNVPMANELRDMGGNILINKDVPVEKYIESLLERYVANPSFITSSFAVQVSDEVLELYRLKVEGRIERALDRVKNAGGKFKAFHEYVDHKTKIGKSLESFLAKVMDNAKGITVLLKMARNIDGHMNMFSNSVYTTFLGLIIASMHLNRLSSVTDKEYFMHNMTFTTFMQYSGIFTGYAMEDSDASLKSHQSAQIASELCRDPQVYRAILHRYSYRDDNEIPVFNIQENAENPFMRILMTVNLFVDIVKKNKYTTGSIEVHKVMYELAYAGYADIDSVKLLGRLFLPMKKQQLLEYAFKLRQACPQKPLVWGITGDMMPVRLICDKECAYSGLHKTFIPEKQSISTDEGDFGVGNAAGIYYPCEFLTEKMRTYYNNLQKKD
ncbi:hypothetical protein [Seleniivibrio sp.]|uniref:hypothetical protein n=1 Tax=Seleniivibrio sp. TaxID=2898801 RepID=UPI0025ED395B|nr:hypothetical protein [Seleniivibrio sp.]MCD8553170.1 hypothetical protein [Seleniivibrio sp.]